MIDFNEMSLNELRQLAAKATSEYDARLSEANANYALIEKLEPILLSYCDGKLMTTGEAVVKVLEGLVIIDAHHNWDFVGAVILESFEVELGDFVADLV